MNRRFLSKFSTKLFAVIAFSGFFPTLASAEPAKFTVQTGFETSTISDVFVPGNRVRGDGVVDYEFDTQFFEFTFTPTNHFFVSYGREEIEYAPYQLPSLLPAFETFSFEDEVEVNRLTAGFILGGHINTLTGEGQEHRISMDYSEIKLKYTEQNLARDGAIVATFRNSLPTSYKTNLKYDFAKGLGNGYSTAFAFSTQVNNNRDEFLDVLDDRAITLGLSKSLINNLVASASYSIKEYAFFGDKTRQGNFGLSLNLVY